MKYTEASLSGPYQSAYQKLRRHKGVVQALNALQVRTGKSIPELVLRICLARWLPEYGVTMTSPVGRCPDEYTVALMTKLRALRAYERLSISAAVVDAIWNWDLKNIAFIDKNGCAALIGDPGTTMLYDETGGSYAAPADSTTTSPFDS